MKKILFIFLFVFPSYLISQECLVLDNDGLPIDLPSDLNCLNDADKIIANRYAPTIRHMADATADAGGDYSGRGVRGFADLIVSPFYDGDYNTGNNWNNLDDKALEHVFNGVEDIFDPYVYYSVVWLEDYWVVSYGFYHARDWAPEDMPGLVEYIFPPAGLDLVAENIICDADCHENDYEGAIFVVSRESKNVVSAFSIAHYKLNKYHDLSGIPTVFIDDRTHAVELNLESDECIDYGLESGFVNADASDCDDCKEFGGFDDNVIYQPLPENSQAEPYVNTYVNDDNRRVGNGEYQLVNIFGTDTESLNQYSNNPNVFTADNNFYNEDTEHPEAGTGSAPWGLANMSYTSKQLEYLTCFTETKNEWCFPRKIFTSFNNFYEIFPDPYPVSINYNPYFPCDDLIISGITIDRAIIEQDTEWSGNGLWNNASFDEIIVRDGATLTIDNTNLDFKSGGKITVKNGGKLTINNSTLNYCGIENFGKWQGIEVFYSPHPFGNITINDSDIIDAETGLKILDRSFFDGNTPNLTISGSKFINNGVGIEATDYRDDGLANITNTEFSDGVGIQLTDSENFIINDCDFLNQPTGISAYNSTFEVLNQSRFEDCGIGVISVGTFPLGSSVYIGDENPGSGNIFDGTDRGILLLGNNSPFGAFIEKNEFTNTRNAIEFNGANKFTVANNRFMGNARAVTVAHTGIATNDLLCNLYDGCTQANNFFTGQNIRTRFLENHSIASAGFNYIMIDAELPPIIGNNGESAANCFGENTSSFFPDIASDQPLNYFYSASTDCKTDPSVNSMVTVTQVFQEGLYCEAIGPFNVENPGGGNSGQIGLHNFEPESACRTCILDSIDLYITKVVAKGGNNPRTVAVESGPETADLKSTERVLNQWIDFGIYVGLKLKDYDYLENILSPMKTWDLQTKHFGLKLIKNDLVGAQAKLASMPANDTKQVYFKEVQSLNLRYLRGFNNENMLTKIDLENLIEIAYSKTSVSGYAKGLFFQMTGTYLENEYPELEEMAKEMEANAEKKEAIFSKTDDGPIRIFPNPATDRIEIVASDNILISNCVLTDFSGSVVFQESVNKNSLTLDLQNLVSGIYLVKIIDEHGDVTIEKIIVNK